MNMCFTERALLGLVLVSFSAPSEAATDGKHYAGSLCQFGDSDFVNKTKSFGQFVNESGATRKVICTLVKDEMAGNIDYAAITAGSAMDENTCRFYERQQDGDLLSWVPDDTDAQATNVTRTEWGDSGILDTGDEVSFAIGCDLPNNTAIYVYSLVELF